MLDNVDDERIQQIREKGSVFAEEVLGTEPYEYQKNFLDTDNRRRCFVAGRQVGKSTVMIWLAIWKWATRKNHDVLIFSPSQRQATEFFDKLKGEIETWIDHPEKYGITYETKTELHGSHGSRIVALTAAGSGTTIRGYTSDTVIIDEAAFVETEFYTSVISPMLLRTEGDFVLGGTPWGQSGFFYDKFHDSRWFSLQVSTLECPDVSMDQVEEMQDDLSRLEYEREVLGKFKEKQNAAFPEETIKRCIYRGEDPQDIYPDRADAPCYLGVDPARYGGDRAVFTSIDEVGNVFDTRIETQTTIPEIENIVRRLNNQRGYEKILVDENGVGGGAFDYLADMTNAEPMKFTIQSKQEIYQNLRRLMEDGEILIPDRKDHIGELRDMEYEEMTSGNVKFHAPDDGRDDFCDSVALAAFARSQEVIADPATGMHSFSRDSVENQQKSYGFQFGS